MDGTRFQLYLRRARGRCCWGAVSSCRSSAGLPWQPSGTRG